VIGWNSWTVIWWLWVSERALRLSRASHPPTNPPTLHMERYYMPSYAMQCLFKQWIEMRENILLQIKATGHLSSQTNRWKWSVIKISKLSSFESPPLVRWSFLYEWWSTLTYQQEKKIGEELRIEVIDLGWILSKVRA